MKLLCILVLLVNSIFVSGQNVGINIAIPSERLHIHDDGNTKLLLRTSSGTSFFTSDSPSNSGLLFQSSGLDRAFMYYSPFSNTLTASVGLNGWTMSSNGDFRVKERVYSLDDLRLDAQENVTIQANGALIKIDPLGNIEIQGINVTIEAQDNLDISAENINIEAENGLQISSGAVSRISAGGSLQVNSANDISIVSAEDISLESNNLDLSMMNSTNLTSGTGLAISSNALFLNTSSNASITVGNNFAIDTGNNFDISVARNYGLNVSKDYSLSALTVSSQVSSTMHLLGTLIRFNNGNKGIALKGDTVEVGGKVGTITSGSSKIFGN